ncbi:MAG: MBL fold metallo-hydrolase [Desulfobacter sp.]|nr:MBL fold metallo-hydrolase [Desulfobacter sp.]WDP85262.1 MAG: MBL fold metallo-hydrolase [Desulfobacter sp.]
MKLTVLVDNNTLIDRYFTAEPGLSLLIEEKDKTLLFDTGYSDLFLKNAGKMGKDLSCLDHLVISHSHLDHTWGLFHYIQYLTELAIENRAYKRPVLTGHPDMFTSVSMDGIPELGSLVSKKKAECHMELRLIREPVCLFPGLTFLGQIPRKNDFEGKTTIGVKQDTGGPDHILDDSALVYESDQGLVIIAGCAHSGICNTIAHAQNICNQTRVADVIGGFHLLDPPQSQLDPTLAFFKDLAPAAVHACHCTDLSSKIALSKVAQVREVGVGMTLDYKSSI